MTAATSQELEFLTAKSLAGERGSMRRPVSKIIRRSTYATHDKEMAIPALDSDSQLRGDASQKEYEEHNINRG
jgi:hypothetical protein